MDKTSRIITRALGWLVCDWTPYKERLVANTTIEKYMIDTVFACDTQMYETGIMYTDENKSNGWIIVEEYSTKKAAEAGHNKWVKYIKRYKPKRLFSIQDNVKVSLLKKEA